MDQVSELKVILTPQQRLKFIDQLLKIDGLSHIKEGIDSAYCPISLTQTPDDIKRYVINRQKILIDKVLYKTGIKGYDPYTAPFSPDKNLNFLPTHIYTVDSGKIASSRFFVGHNITASTGFGVELEKASKYNRIAVILYDKHIRISRMQPHRVIYLEYDNFEKQIPDFIEVFKYLKTFEPGIGFHNNVPVLLGFKGKKVFDLEQEVYQRFPHLQYKYNGKIPILKLRSENPNIFYEHINKNESTR